MVPLRWISLALFLIISIQSNAQRKRQPEWVSATPVDAWSYYGIGIASTEETDYRDKARAMALKEISEKIFVSIDSESNLKMTYGGDDTRYELNEEITTLTANRLEGYRKVEDWQDRRSDLYYVLFKLDKDIYKRNREQHLERVLEKIQFEKDRALKFFLLDDYTSAFSYLESALELIDEELQRFPEPDFEYELRSEQDEIAAYYEDRISRVKIVSTANNLLFDPLTQQKTVISYAAIDKISGKNLMNFPVKLHMISGDVFDYEVQYGLDSSQIDIYGLLPDKGEALFRIRPDLSGDYLEKNDLLSQLVNFMESKTISVIFQPYSVYFEKRKQNTPEEQRLLVFFRNFLRFCSINTVEDPAVAQYRVAFDTEMFSSGSSGGITTEIDGWLSAKRPDGSVAFKTDFTKIRAVGFSPEDSRKQAIESLLRSIDYPLQEMIQFFCGQRH